MSMFCDVLWSSSSYIEQKYRTNSSAMKTGSCISTFTKVNFSTSEWCLFKFTRSRKVQGVCPNKANREVKDHEVFFFC